MRPIWIVLLPSFARRPFTHSIHSIAEPIMQRLTRKMLNRHTFRSVVAATLAAAACNEPTTSVVPEVPLSAAVVKFWESGASVAWI